MGAERGWVSGRQQRDKPLQPQQEGLWPNSKAFAQVGVWGAGLGERSSWMNHLCLHLLYLLPGMV